MRVPDRLVSLVEDGIVEEVVRPLMSGKEAQVFLVIAGGEERVAKVYKESTQRLFKHRTEYTEGRRTRNSRDQRAMGKRSKHGREKDEKSWQTAEVDMIYRLKDAGVRVPTPYSFMDGVLVMEMITDAEGNPAPQIGTMQFGRKEALSVFDLLIQEVVRMLCAGVIHGDLSDFNVLMSADGPVVIDFPQAVDSANNPGARKLLIRDVDNLHRFVGRFVTGLRRLPYAEEMWELYERGELTKDTKLEGTWAPPKHVADVDAVLREIDTAEREEWERREQLSGNPRDLRSGVDSRRGPAKRDRGTATPSDTHADGAKARPQPDASPTENAPARGGGHSGGRGSRDGRAGAGRPNAGRAPAGDSDRPRQERADGPARDNDRSRSGRRRSGGAPGDRRGDPRANNERSGRGRPDNGRSANDRSNRDRSSDPQRSDARSQAVRSDGSNPPANRGDARRAPSRRADRPGSSGPGSNGQGSSGQGSNGQESNGPRSRGQRSGGQRSRRPDPDRRNADNPRSDSRRPDNPRSDNPRSGDPRSDSPRSDNPRSDSQRSDPQRSDDRDRGRRQDGRRDGGERSGAQGRSGGVRSGERRPQEPRGGAGNVADSPASRDRTKEERPRDEPSGQDGGRSTNRPRRSSRGPSASRRR